MRTSPDLAPKPAFAAIQTLTRLLAGCRLDRRIDTGNTNDFVLLFRGKHQSKLAAWTTGAAGEVSLPVKRTDADELSFINGAGQAGKIAIKIGQAVIPLDGRPKYVDLNSARLVLK